MIETIRNNFGHDTTTDEVLEGIDLTGSPRPPTRCI